MADVEIPLAEAIQALRSELVAAAQAAEGESLRFALGPITLEFQFVISREVGGEGGIKFWVVSLTGKGSQISAATHTVKLTLTPAGGDVLVKSDVRERPS